MNAKLTLSFINAFEKTSNELLGYSDDTPAEAAKRKAKRKDKGVSLKELKKKAAHEYPQDVGESIMRRKKKGLKTDDKDMKYPA